MGKVSLIISFSFLLCSHVLLCCMAFAVLGVYLWEMERSVVRDVEESKGGREEEVEGDQEERKNQQEDSTVRGRSSSFVYEKEEHAYDWSIVWKSQTQAGLILPSMLENDYPEERLGSTSIRIFPSPAGLLCIAFRVSCSYFFLSALFLLDCLCLPILEVCLT